MILRQDSLGIFSFVLNLPLVALSAQALRQSHANEGMPTRYQDACSVFQACSVMSSLNDTGAVSMRASSASR